MIISLVILMVLTLLLVYLGPRDVVLTDPSSIAALAAIMTSSNSLRSLLSDMTFPTTSEISLRLRC